jgi:hypothetical protein
MDKFGNIAAGFSVSSPSSHPGINFAGRLASDSSGTLSGEGTIIEGTGSENCEGEQICGRWGDYSSMNVDPEDDCSFWYTNEYYQAEVGAENANDWHTQIAELRAPSCSS